MIDIRPAVPEDAAACTALVRSAYQRYVAGMGREPGPMSDDYPALIDSGEVWVAHDERVLTGVLVLETAVDHLLVENLAVAPERQGTGLGSTLLTFAESQARARELPEVRLYTNEAMTDNVVFYARRGYVETHRGVYGGFRRVFFAKSLRSFTAGTERSFAHVHLPDSP